MIRFAPINVPFVRRRQTAAVILWFAIGPILALLFMALLFHQPFTPFCLAYIVFILIDPSPETGGRKIMWVRELSFWKWFRDYFPITLEKTVDLDPSKNYVFGYHPHGVISLGALANFGTEANGFAKKFPGINLRLLTLATNFNIPVFRELLLSMNICSVSRRSCDTILSKGPGNSLMIVPGGAAEALYAFPNKIDLVLQKRKGFIKVALRHGASLVPVLAFGENDVWNQVPNPQGSLLRKCQQTFQKYASFSPPLFHGRGVINYDVGMMPYRRGIATIVGNPIDCPKIPNPTEKDVLEYQGKYVAELMRMFEQHKNRLAPHVPELKLVE